MNQFINLGYYSLIIGGFLALPFFVLFIILKTRLKNYFFNLNQHHTISKLFISIIFLLTFIAIQYIALPYLEITDSNSLILIQKGLTILALISFYLVISQALNLLLNKYNQYAISKKRPLKPLFQALKIILFIILLFGTFAIILNKDAFIVMGSVSTLAAFVSFIFKEIILGFFAGIQLTSSETIRIGDYIEVKPLSITGTVLSINLTTITLSQTNNSIITVPAYSLITNPIINFRHLYESQGRLYQKTFIFTNTKADSNSIQQFINETKDFLSNHHQVNQSLPIYVVLDQVSQSGIGFNVQCHSTLTEFASFSDFSSDLTLNIYQLATKKSLNQLSHVIMYQQ